MEGYDRTVEAIASAMGERLLGVHTDRGETTLIVDRGSIRQVCQILRDGYERYLHLSGVCGVDYLDLGLEPRFAVVYHLYSPSARRRLNLKVPVEESDPVVPSVVPVWPAANWHEREVFDLFGIRFEGHPRLTRILMPEDATGHPLRKDFPLGGEEIQFSHNFSTARATERVAVHSRVETDMLSRLQLSPDGEEMLLNFGPQHPATHGVLRLVLALDGEVLTDCSPVIGYLHSGFDKTYENKKYQQCVTLTDRMDYLNPLGNNLAFALTVEKLLGIEAPPRAQVARVLLAELTRIQSHLVAVGSGALDLGASSVMMYAFRERETLLDIFEICSGQRMMTSYIRPGGLARDLPSGFEEKVQAFVDSFPERLEEYHGLLTRNKIWLDRMERVGRLTADQCVEWGITGPVLRASGVARDLRRDQPYCGYESYDFDVITREEGDCYARYLVRMDEMRESLRIVRQALARIPEGPYVVDDHKIAFPPRAEISTSMEALIHHFKLATEGYRVPPGEVYCSIESPRGELGFYIISDGSARPYRCHARTPSFANLQSLPIMARGGMVADLVPIIASIDPIMGDVDR